MARKISVEIIGDSASLERAFKRSGSAADSFSAKINSGTRSIAKGAFVAGAALSTLAVTVGVKSVQAASNLGEQINKVGVVFGKSAASIKAWATTTAASIGISNRAALEAAGTFGNMLVPMGFARSEAAGMSKRMIQLAADMASFNNASPEETLDALRAGLAGETEPLRRFGIFLNQDRIAAEALSKGIVKTTKDTTKIKVATLAVDKAMRDHTKTIKKYGAGSREANESQVEMEVAQDRLTKALKGTTPKLTAQEKAMATYSVIMKDTADTQGDFNRTSGSLPNLLRSIRASVEDLSAAFGEGLLPVVQKVAKNLQQNLADPAFRERIRALGKIVGQTLFKAFEAISKWFSQNWDGIKSAFRTGADLAGKVAKAAQGIFDKLKMVSSVTPGGSGTLLGVILTGALAVKLAQIAGSLKLIQTRLMLLRATPWVIAISLVLLNRDAIDKWVKGKLGRFYGGGSGDLTTPEGWKRAPKWVREEHLKRGGKIPRPMAPYGGPRAHGGSVMPGVSYTVGERGRETFVPSVPGHIIPNGGGIIVVPVYLDGREIARVVTDHQQRFAKHGTSQTRGFQAGLNLGLG